MRNQLPKTTAQKTPEIQTNRAKPQKQTKQPKKQPQPQLLRQRAEGKAARETVHRPAGTGRKRHRHRRKISHTWKHMRLLTRTLLVFALAEFCISDSLPEPDDITKTETE